MKTRCNSLNSIIGIVILLSFLTAMNGCSKSDDGGSDAAINKVSIKSKTPNTPASLKFDEEVIIIYDYEIADPNGGRIWFSLIPTGVFLPRIAILHPHYLLERVQERL